MTLRPTAAEERWLALARRLPRSSTTAVFAEHTGDWRTANLWTRSAFFVLGLLMIGASYMYYRFERQLEDYFANQKNQPKGSS